MRMTSLSLVALLAGCPDRPIGSVYPVQVKVETKELPANPNRDVDILFVIDDSGSMQEEQASLRANFGKFMDVLATIEGGLPNVHIGVVTSNMGQSAVDGVGTAPFGTPCAGAGDDGVLRQTTGVSGRYIIDEEGGGGARTRNYSGTLADAFSALADVGTTGCGIEQHLAATKRALQNTQNAGFLRESAKLAVIFIADEDDCSLQSKALFEGSTDGTVVNFRCTKDGIECDGNPDLSAPGLRTNCRPRIGSPLVAEVDGYVDFVRGLKGRPDRDVIVAGIIGDPRPVEIIKDNQDRSVLRPSCQYAGQFAYPAVRTNDFLEQFELSIRATICEPDLSEALVRIGALLKRPFGDPCFEGTVADLDPETPGLQADCAVSDWRSLPGGNDVEVGLIPACASGQIPCWRVEHDAEKCHYTPTKMKLVIDRGGALLASDMFVKAACVTTDPSGMVQ
jgi:hypothetical protein